MGQETVDLVGGAFGGLLLNVCTYLYTLTTTSSNESSFLCPSRSQANLTVAYQRNWVRFGGLLGVCVWTLSMHLHTRPTRVSTRYNLYAQTEQSKKSVPPSRKPTHSHGRNAKNASLNPSHPISVSREKVYVHPTSNVSPDSPPKLAPATPSDHLRTHPLL